MMPADEASSGDPIMMRKTLTRLALWAAVLLVANVSYFSKGFHRPFAWVFVGFDAIFAVSAAVALAAASRRA